MRVGLCLLFFVAAVFAQAQDPNAQQQADVGPTILSRTDMQVPAQVPRQPSENSFNYFLFTDGFFNIGVPVNEPGSQASGNSAGFDVGGGLDLYHRFHRGSVSVAYFGSFRDYSNSFYYTGFQQGLNFNFNYALTRRLALSLLQNVATAPNGTGGYQFAGNSFSGANGLAGETRLFLTGGTLTYQQTPRLSYQLTGDFFVSQYRPVSINDSLGGQGLVNVSYRKSKQATIAFSYSFAHFTYSQNSHDVTNSQTAYATYAYALTPRTQFSLSGGATSADVTQGFLLISPPVLVIAHSTTVFPYFAGSLSHSARRGSASIQASQSVLAGNGFLTTSKAISVTGSATYSTSPKWALSGYVGYQHLSALGTGQASDAYNSFFAGAGFGYKLSRHFGLKSNFNYGLYQANAGVPGQPNAWFSFGITYSSGDRPVIFF